MQFKSRVIPSEITQSQRLSHGGPSQSVIPFLKLLGAKSLSSAFKSIPRMCLSAVLNLRLTKLEPSTSMS